MTENLWKFTQKMFRTYAHLVRKFLLVDALTKITTVNYYAFTSTNMATKHKVIISFYEKLEYEKEVWKMTVLPTAILHLMKHDQWYGYYFQKSSQIEINTYKCFYSFLFAKSFPSNSTIFFFTDYLNICKKPNSKLQKVCDSYYLFVSKHDILWIVFE